jgi:hypothetical protein
VAGAGQRKREVFTYARTKVGQWLKLIAPAMVDRMASKAIEEGR